MIYLDLEEQIKYIAELTALDYELAEKYVYAEDRYYDIIDLNVYPGGERENASIGIVDEGELIKYISKETGMDLDMCNRFAVSTIVFAWETGILSRYSFSFEEIAFMKGAVNILNSKKEY